MDQNNHEMQSFFWEYRMDLQFPFSALDYRVTDTVSEGMPRLHWHSFYEVGICTSGEGIFHFEGKSYHYREGDIFLINNLERHGAAAAAESDTHFRFFLFLPELLLEGAPLQAAEYLLPFRYDSARFCNRIDGQSETGMRLRPILEELWKDSSTSRPGKERLIRSRLQLLLAEVCSLMGLEEDAALAAGVADYLRLRPALAYIDAHFTEKLIQKEIAALCYLSESRFRHLFRSQMHMSFQDYVARLRYLEARRRIASGDGSIEDAIRSAGITNSYNFYQMFHEIEGMTPFAWRKKLQSESRDSRI